MIIKFEPSGTHIHKGVLKIRVDVFPEPTDACYSKYLVDGVSTPCLCNFIYVNEDETVNEFDRKPTDAEWEDEEKLRAIPTHKVAITDFINSIFNEQVSLDDGKTFASRKSLVDYFQSRDDGIAAISKVMRTTRRPATPVTVIQRNIDLAVCDDKDAQGLIGLSVAEAAKLKALMAKFNTDLAEIK